jgi:UPF0271 protein
MRNLLLAARSAGIGAGAHPSYPDREHFGRRTLSIPAAELRKAITAQLRCLLEIAATCDVTLTHVKPHGALYSAAARQASIAELILESIAQCGIAPAVFGPPGSALLLLAPHYSMQPVTEAFADRVYEPDGTLRDRSRTGALLQDPHQAAAQALSIAESGVARRGSGEFFSIRAQTICVHSDTPNAVLILRAVHQLLHDSGILVRTPQDRD